MLAKLTADSLSLWQGQELVVWSPIQDDTDLDHLLGQMGYTQQQDWQVQQDYLVTTVK